MKIIPLVILIGLSLIDIGIVMGKHGEPRKENYDVIAKITASVIEWALIWWVIS